ncbi:TRAP-type mannitol/chloroaromatic compound transport system substrate-binding protein [Scopulibacillus daqui]|uniref:TRAP-type mannitol/chloroaromatic compound transport system substrate-binding protein n=1 Tax=Scopulibacillus daqui TaxID=1469162 RepID=A0ABS2PZ69_9BACL|nr:DUF3907 family protein [Scopulibacillus daqui]MBM7645343.1 TRAP-type mannitol/chloroaromatic compound transport system substrate-binding protein [Scopulibacillus daqui]
MDTPHDKRVDGVKRILQHVSSVLENYLEETTVSMLIEEKNDVEKKDYQAVLSSIRRLSVHVEDSIDLCDRLSRSAYLSEAAKNKAFKKLYVHCVEAFYNPKNDAWKENSRASYSNKMGIEFNRPVGGSLIELMKTISPDFDKLREELEIYEHQF